MEKKFRDGRKHKGVGNQGDKRGAPKPVSKKVGICGKSDANPRWGAGAK